MKYLLRADNVFGAVQSKEGMVFAKVTSQNKISKSIKGNLKKKIVATQQVDVQTPDEISLQGHL